MITLAKNIGFCFGVTRAYEQTLANLNGKIYSLGEIVHNQSVVKELKDKGLIVINEISEVPNNSNLIIRAHGVSPDIYEIAKSRNINIIDLTCPKVANVHKMVEKNNDNFIVIIGAKNHPEVIGTCGYAKNCFVIENISDILNLTKIIKDEKIIVYTQTTFSVKKFQEISKLLMEKFSNIEINSCICPSTEIRQEEVINLSKTNDLVIVIGSKNSSNTLKLYELAKNNTNSLLIENYHELKDTKLDIYKDIAIVSGASAPKNLSLEVYDYLMNLH